MPADTKDKEEAKDEVLVKWRSDIFRVDLKQNQIDDSNKFRQFMQDLTNVEKSSQIFVIRKKKYSVDQNFDLNLLIGQKILMIGERSENFASSPPSSSTDKKSNAENPQNKIEESEKSNGHSQRQQHLILKEDVKLIAGLQNIENTCFINAVIQSLKNLPGFREIIRVDQSNKQHVMAIKDKLFDKLRDLINQMCYSDNSKSVDVENRIDSVTRSVIKLVFFIRMNLQVFNEKSPNGIYMQQDANDFLIYVLNHLEEVYSTMLHTENLVRKSFKFILEAKTKNMENESEEIIISEETNYILNLHINNETRHIFSCIKNAMKEELEKTSEILQKNCKYQRHFAFKRLPKYLVLSLSRFYFREDVSVNAKILKSIEFPLEFDLFEFCEENLKKKLEKNRKIIRDLQQKNSSNTTTTTTNDDDDDDNNKNYSIFQDNLENDKYSSGSGIYEVKSIVTHQGRASDTGHYIAWLKPSISDLGFGNYEDFWFKVDDLNVTTVKASEILALKGGIDTHIAYTFILGPKELKISNDCNYNNKKQA